MKRRPLGLFFGLAFGISWGLAVLLLVFREPLTARFGEIDLTAPFWKAYYHLAVYAPAFAAFGTIAALHGRAGVKRFARRLLHWNVGWRWWGIVLLGFPALHFLTSALANALGSEHVPLWKLAPWYMGVPLFAWSLINGPGPMEELGWRGVALPLLQRRFSALGASVLLGLIWGCWHLPAFYVSAMPQAGISPLLFILADVPFAVLLTVVYNGTGGSIPMAFLIHGIGNFDYGVDVMMTNTELFVSFAVQSAVVVVLVIWLGPAALDRRKHTDVLHSGAVAAGTPEADAT